MMRCRACLVTVDYPCAEENCRAALALAPQNEEARTHLAKALIGRAQESILACRCDVALGKLNEIEALDRSKRSDNTLVIFASDNGADRRGRNAPYRGGKSGLFEGGIRVPCIIRWPGRIEPDTVSDQMSIMMDLTASMACGAGAEAPKDRPFDGVDIIRDLETKRPTYKRTLFWRSRRGERTWRAVRDGHMKYVTQTDGDKVERHLFDLEKDPGEETNLLEARPVEASRLKDLLDDWQADVKPIR